MENFPDSITRAFPLEDEGLSAPASFMASLEMPGCCPMLLPEHKAARRELVLGTAGAFLVHMLAAATLLLSPFIKPPRHAQEPFITAYSAGGERTGCSASGAGTGGSAGSGKHPEQYPPEVKPGEKETASGVPPAKISGRAVSPARNRRKPPAPAGTAPAQAPESTPAGDFRKTSENAGDRASEGPRADFSGGRTEGMESGKGTGEGPGGPSSGTGPYGEFDAASVDKVPQILKKIEPAYPGRARSLGICGKVVVKFLVETDGRVSKPSIVEAHPRGYFEQSTLEAVSHWRFKPGCFRGKDVATWVILPVQFQLTEQD
jgi:protein TonB